MKNLIALDIKSPVTVGRNRCEGLAARRSAGRRLSASKGATQEEGRRGGVTAFSEARPWRAWPRRRLAGQWVPDPLPAGRRPAVGPVLAMQEGFAARKIGYALDATSSTGRLLAKKHARLLASTYLVDCRRNTGAQLVAD